MTIIVTLSYIILINEKKRKIIIQEILLVFTNLTDLLKID